MLCGPSYLQVAVGVVKNSQGSILLALRKPSLHQGGLWEFPGGKIEPGETTLQALRRELKEEVGLFVGAATPLITVRHQYPNRAVQLNVFLVAKFTGEAEGLEGQAIAWVRPDELSRYPLPTANRPIITAAQLPPYYAILDDAPEGQLLPNLQSILSKGVKLVQVRLKTTPQPVLSRFLATAYPLCQSHQAWLLLNSATALGFCADADGLHLTSRHLLALDERPQGYRWVAASCHNAYELSHAEKMGLDFAVLAPVLATQSHPETPALGWQRFSDWVQSSHLPVYALGGMCLADLATARRAGGQGIAAIRAFLA